MSLTRRAGVVFLCAFAYLGWLAASRFVLTLNDEGIYLDGGLRVLHGQMPYKDFFSLTGPGTFALEAASLRVFGATLAAGRMPVVWDIAILTACLFWLICKLSDSKFSGQLTAAFASFTFLAFVTLGDTAVVANHRWDSSAWAVLAATLIVAGVDSKRSSAITFAAGIAVGIAAWCTPPVALAVVALGGLSGGLSCDPTPCCCLRGRRYRRVRGGTDLDHLDGSVICDARFASVERVQLHGRQPGLVWLGDGRIREPSARNIGRGYSDHDRACCSFSPCRRRCHSSARSGYGNARPATIVVLLVTGFALILSTYPRWDLNHLTWVSAPFYALAAALIARTSFKKTRGGDRADRRGIVLHGQHPAAPPGDHTSHQHRERSWQAGGSGCSGDDPGASETFRYVVRISRTGRCSISSPERTIRRDIPSCSRECFPIKTSRKR